MYSATFKIRVLFQMPLWLSMHVYSPYLRNMDSFVYTYTVCGASPKWALEYISSAHHVPSVTAFTCKLYTCSVEKSVLRTQQQGLLS